MKPRSTIFLQAVIVLVAIVSIIIMIRMPLTEGRAKNSDLLHIYLDPLILYVYAASILFFVSLYKVFRLLDYIGQNKAFSPNTINALRSIKRYAIVLGILIMAAGIFIRIFHAKDDDPVGFLVICFVATLVSVVVANAAAVFEKILQNGVDIKSENEQLHGQLEQ
ncbi:MAG: DUF2975 domain-containing protein [Lacibacter sp.]